MTPTEVIIVGMLAGALVLQLAHLYLGVQTMTVADDIKAGQARAATALENIAKDVRELVAKMAEPGSIGTADAEAIKAKGEEIASGLEAVAAIYRNAEEPPQTEETQPQ